MTISSDLSPLILISLITKNSFEMSMVVWISFLLGPSHKVSSANAEVEDRKDSDIMLLLFDNLGVIV